jgi:transposase
MQKKYRINLPAEERKLALETKRNLQNSQTIRNRAEILLLADESIGKIATNKEIALRVGVSVITVYNTLKDYCREGAEEVLKYAKRAEPPRARLVSGEKEARIIAVACGEPPKGYSRWTVRLLTEKVLELEILEEGSRETVRRTLKKLNLSLI